MKKTLLTIVGLGILSTTLSANSLPEFNEYLKIKIGNYFEKDGFSIGGHTKVFEFEKSNLIIKTQEGYNGSFFGNIGTDLNYEVIPSLNLTVYSRLETFKAIINDENKRNFGKIGGVGISFLDPISSMFIKDPLIVETKLGFGFLESDVKIEKEINIYLPINKNLKLEVGFSEKTLERNSEKTNMIETGFFYKF
jgi:hypothetical protein